MNKRSRRWAVAGWVTALRPPVVRGVTTALVTDIGPHGPTSDYATTACCRQRYEIHRYFVYGNLRPSSVGVVKFLTTTCHSQTWTKLRTRSQTHDYGGSQRSEWRDGVPEALEHVRSFHNLDANVFLQKISVVAGIGRQKLGYSSKSFGDSESGRFNEAPSLCHEQVARGSER